MSDPLVCYKDKHLKHLWSVSTDACVHCGMWRLMYLLTKAEARRLAVEYVRELRDTSGTPSG